VAALDGVNEKIERARVHQRDLAQRLIAVLGPDEQSFVLDQEPADGRYALRVSGVPTVDPEWRTIIGDCLFNLRSALDHLASQLVILDGGTPTSATTFRIRKTPLVQKGQPVPMQLDPAIARQDILDVLEKVQPYADTGQPPDDPGFNPLWSLHRLNIIDKHRQLLVVVSTLSLGETFWGWSGEQAKPDFYLNRVALRNDGTPVGWFDFHGRVPPPDFTPNAALHLVINEQELPHLTDRSAQDVLQDTIFHVEHMVDFKFRPLFVTESTTED
jgi:hypothetical protein